MENVRSMNGYFNWFPDHNENGLTAYDLRIMAEHLDKKNAKHHARVLQSTLNKKLEKGGYKVYINNSLVDCVPTTEEVLTVIGKSAFGSLTSVSHTNKSVDCSEFVPY